jgi:hypothetical protein
MTVDMVALPELGAKRGETGRNGAKRGETSETDHTQKRRSRHSAISTKP